MNYDQRTVELETKDREVEDAQEQLSKKILIINSKDSEVQQARDSLATQRKKYTEVLSSLIRDIVDVGECMNSTQLQVRKATHVFAYYFPLQEIR